MNVDILYFAGCPNHRPAVALVRSVATELGVNTNVREVEVHSPNDAERLRFLGSPSIQVDGVDVEVGAREQRDFATSCRTYGGNGLPSREVVRAALATQTSASTASAQPTALLFRSH